MCTATSILTIKMKEAQLKRLMNQRENCVSYKHYTANMKVVLAPTKAADLDMYDIVHGH